MEFLNATRMAAGYTLGVDPSGRESLVVVVKGTFDLPAPGAAPVLSAEQRALGMADTFTGAPGFSAPVHEMDYAPAKPACDVLLVGSAHAPPGQAVTRTEVSLSVGTLTKRIAVVGDRTWDRTLGGVRATPPRAFTRMPLGYDHAHGGTVTLGDGRTASYAPNPVGRGWHPRAADAAGQPLANLEHPERRVESPDDAVPPMAFGPLGRGWAGRAELAGTYDQRWLDDHFPFLPPDFDPRYHQAAPPDQRLSPGAGPIPVRLVNLTPDGLRTFDLPHFPAPIHVFPRQGGREDLHALLDTIAFEPDAGCFTMTWRLARPLRRDLFEVAQVLVGRKGPAWWQARERAAFPIPVVMVPMARAEAAS